MHGLFKLIFTIKTPVPTSVLKDFFSKTGYKMGHYFYFFFDIRDDKHMNPSHVNDFVSYYYKERKQK